VIIERNNFPTGGGLTAYRIANTKFPTPRRFAFFDSVFGRKFWIELQCDDLENRPHVRPTEIYLLLNFMFGHRVAWARGYIGIGACFAVLDRDLQNTLRVVFDLPFAFGYWECISTDFAHCPGIEGALDNSHPTLWIECGKRFSTPYILSSLSHTTLLLTPSRRSIRYRLLGETPTRRRKETLRRDHEAILQMHGVFLPLLGGLYCLCVLARPISWLSA
jgi:hypothetical protein